MTQQVKYLPAMWETQEIRVWFQSSSPSSESSEGSSVQIPVTEPLFLHLKNLSWPCDQWSLVGEGHATSKAGSEECSGLCQCLLEHWPWCSGAMLYENQGAMWRGPSGGDQRAICQLNSQTSSTTTCSQHAWGQFWPSRLPVLPPSTSHEAEEPSNQISEFWDIVSCCFMQLCFGVINYQIRNAYFYSDLNIYIYIYIYFQGFPGGSVKKNSHAYAGDMGLSPDLGGSLMSQSN